MYAQVKVATYVQRSSHVYTKVHVCPCMCMHFIAYFSACNMHVKRLLHACGIVFVANLYHSMCGHMHIEMFKRTAGLGYG